VYEIGLTLLDYKIQGREQTGVFFVAKKFYSAVVQRL